MSTLFQQPIPPQADFEWYQLEQIAIIDCQEPLIDTQTLTHVKTRPMYFLQGIPDALPTCYVRQSIAHKLEQISQSLPAGLHLVVLDGWRPLTVQQRLREAFLLDIQQRFPHLSEEEQQHTLNQFVAQPSSNPKRPSPHVTGGSVDVSICDADGNLLDMGSAFDAPVDESWTSALESLPASAAQQNRRLLYHSMISHGFSNMPSEWWHFDFGNQLWALRTGKEWAVYGLVDIGLPNSI